MNSDFFSGIEKVHFLTEKTNYRILCVLLNQSDGISIKEVADQLKISKARAKYRLERFVKRHFCLVNIDVPKLETMRLTKSYKILVMLRPNLRTPLNNFVEYIDELTVSSIKVKVK